MARFIYQAKNEIGNSVSGVLEADSEEEVATSLPDGNDPFTDFTGRGPEYQLGGYVERV